MIARVWRGIAFPDKVDDYMGHFRQSVLPELHRIDGFKEAYVLRRTIESGVELTVQTIWESMDAIRKFAGENVETAVVAHEAKAFFRQFDSFVTHHEILVHERLRRKGVSMFQKHNPSGYTCPVPGIERKTLVYGERTLMTQFLLKKGNPLPAHSHPHEQTGYLVKGRIRLSIGSEQNDVNPGDSWCIPGGVEHGAEILEDSTAIEVFSPVREDYLPKETR
jgi:quercetin dioxygenase-like cupin family protein